MKMMSESMRSASGENVFRVVVDLLQRDMENAGTSEQAFRGMFGEVRKQIVDALVAELLPRVKDRMIEQLDLDVLLREATATLIKEKLFK